MKRKFNSNVNQSINSRRDQRLANYNRKKASVAKAYSQKIQKVSYEEYKRARKTYERDQRRLEANSKRKKELESWFTDNKVLMDGIYIYSWAGWVYFLLLVGAFTIFTFWN